MIKRYLLILCLFLIIITSTSCSCCFEAIVEGTCEAIFELVFAELEVDFEMLFEPLRLFHENNERWSDSKEELIEFSCEMENMRFKTQEDGSLNIKLKRVAIAEDGTKQCYSKEYTIDIDECEIQIQKFNLETENGARLTMTNKEQ